MNQQGLHLHHGLPIVGWCDWHAEIGIIGRPESGQDLLTERTLLMSEASSSEV